MVMDLFGDDVVDESTVARRVFRDFDKWLWAGDRRCSRERGDRWNAVPCRINALTASFSEFLYAASLQFYASHCTGISFAFYR